MAADDPRAELLGLVEEVGEQLAYLRELGVSLIDATLPDEPHAATQGAVRAASGQNRSAPRAVEQTSALRRNAEAGARSPDDSPSFAARHTPPPEAPPARPEPPAVSNQPAPESKDMPSRKPVRTPDPVPPPPRETLFGDIAPADELSLPREGETFEDIRNDIGECMRCPLCCEGRNRIVHSEGNQKARLMFVGEAPGANEDEQGRPFVGRAGELLNKIIEAIGMKRADVFIGNVNRCRPQGNRTPTMAEAAVCKPFLLREIAIVRPEVIVVLGNTAFHNLLDTKEGITKARGQFKDYKGIKVMPTFHPAYLLRDPSKKRETWDDMKKVRDYLNKTKAEK
jgi:DNA polymerase